MQINLSKAQKILDNIKAELNKYSDIQYQCNLVSVSYLHQGSENMEKQLVEKVNYERNKITEYFDLMKDLSNLKESLFMGNIKSGVSKCLSQIDNQKKIKGFFERFLKNSDKNIVNHINSDDIDNFYHNEVERLKNAKERLIIKSIPSDL